MKYLFLDDLRVPEDVTWVMNMPIDADWIIVRTCDEAIKWVLENGWPNFISFDHDLGCIEEIEKSGYTFAKWLVNYALDGNPPPSDFNFVVHSQNTIGKVDITAIINNYLTYFERFGK